MSVIVKKLYYSISEVAEMTEVKQYVLRYWENEFDILHPAKNRAGTRIYTKEDITNILLVKRLLYDEKYTVEGAKIRLKEIMDATGSTPEPLQNQINKIRRELEAAKNALDL